MVLLSVVDPRCKTTIPGRIPLELHGGGTASDLDLVMSFRYHSPAIPVITHDAIPPGTTCLHMLRRNDITVTRHVIPLRANLARRLRHNDVTVTRRVSLLSVIELRRYLAGLPMHGIGIMLQIAMAVADTGQELPMLRSSIPRRFILSGGGLPLIPDRVSLDLRQKSCQAGCQLFTIRHETLASGPAACIKRATPVCVPVALIP